MAKALPLRRRLRIFFLKWHRTIGLFASFFVLLLVITGIALNHGNELGIDHQPLPHSMLALYGVEIETPTSGYSIAGDWLVESQQQLFFNEQPVSVCHPPLVGAIPFAEELLVACQNGVALFTQSGELIERAGDNPEPLVAMMALPNSDKVLMKGQFKHYTFDMSRFEWSDFEVTKSEMAWLKPTALPDALAKGIAKKSVVTEITWERLVLDLHSGRLFGQWGVWFMDLIAVLLAVLAISGVWLRISRP
ncbi:MAG: PepSY domain-containing protein [Pseudomonadales bacterium]|nr:PepSY domain-containing protein [Pseudomonadales bacterium]